MVSSDDEDAYGNALGLYRTYLGSLVQPADDDAAALAHVHHGTQSPLSEDEQSAQSEEVQLYGLFMRSLITNENEVAGTAADEEQRKNEQQSGERNVRVRNNGDDNGLQWTAVQGDTLIGKTVMAGSPSSTPLTRNEKIERDEWLARSLSVKKTTDDVELSAQQQLVQDAKSFLPSRGVAAVSAAPTKSLRSLTLGDAATKKLTTHVGSVLVPDTNGRTSKSSTDPWVLSTATEAKATKRTPDRPILSVHVGKPKISVGVGGGSTPDTTSTTTIRDNEADLDPETGDTTRMYAVPWSLETTSKTKPHGPAFVTPTNNGSEKEDDAVAAPKSNKWRIKSVGSLRQATWQQSLNDEEIPSSERPKSRFFMFRQDPLNDGQVTTRSSAKQTKSRFWKGVDCIRDFFSTPMRCATAFMMACHFVSSTISLASFTHRRQCCDEVVDLNSHAVFRIVSTVYFLWVLIHIPPVVVKGQVRFWTIPNPYFGYVLASTLALHSFFWRAVSAFVLESTAMTLQLIMVHLKDFKWRWIRLVVTLMPLILCLAHVFLVFVNASGQCVVHTKDGWIRTGDNACIICTGDNLPLILDKYRDPCVRPSTRYSSDIWGEHGDFCGSETNTFCFYSYAG